MVFRTRKYERLGEEEKEERYVRNRVHEELLIVCVKCCVCVYVSVRNSHLYLYINM